MDILIRPLITEKMTQVSDKYNKVGFMVAKEAKKPEIMKAIERFYGVKVIRVNTMNYKGKVKRRNTRAGVIAGRTNAYKKAIVTLREGDKIDFYSNI